MWNAWSAQAKDSLTQALEKTGDVISKAATEAGKAAQKGEAAIKKATTTEASLPEKESDTAPKESTPNEATTPTNTNDPKQLLTSLGANLSAVLNQTKHNLQTVVEEQQQKLTEQIHKAREQAYKRDVSLPLDTVALRDAQVVYLTDRLVSMAHPAIASQTDPNVTGARKLAAVGHLLTKRHGGHYMVYNISEVSYEARILEHQVLEYSFPGSPSPPLGLWLKLLMNMEAWLQADSRNIAVVHCLTGKGRSSLVLAAFLCWRQEAGFGNMHAAFEYIAACKQLPADALTIPSQRRYAGYFTNMLDGVRPAQPPLLLKRIVLNRAPRYATGPPRTDLVEGEHDLQGCAPYLQLFKAGKLLHTTACQLHFSQAPDEIPFCQVADGALTFPVDRIVQGDVLIRCRHLTAHGQRVSMFRVAVHTGYVPPKVLRLTKSDLDGACSDDERYDDDFVVDLIFEPMDSKEASALLEQQERELREHAAELIHQETDVKTTVTATTYDTLLHRDSRFWDVIAERRQRPPSEGIVGPTIGRRRDFGTPIASPEGKKPASTSEETPTFSIGGMDFLPTPKDNESPSKPDSLMEALLGALDPQQPRAEQEVVIFESEESEGTIVELPPAAAADSQAEATLPVTNLSTPTIPAAAAAATVDDTPADATDEAMAALLADADLELDDDMAALIDSGAIDVDEDADLQDLESFLKD